MRNAFSRTQSKQFLALILPNSNNLFVQKKNMKKKKHFILSEEEKKELDRKIENITNHPETLVTWEDVKEKMTDIEFAKNVQNYINKILQKE